MSSAGSACLIRQQTFQMPKLKLMCLLIALLLLQCPCQARQYHHNQINAKNNKNVLESAEELLAENGVQRPEQEQLEVVAKNVAIAEWINEHNDAEWEASSQWPFAGMGEEQLLGMLGTPVEEKHQMRLANDNKDGREYYKAIDEGKSKSARQKRGTAENNVEATTQETNGKNPSSVEDIEADSIFPQLPEHFDIRQKWPECAVLFSRNPFQGDTCRTCWSVTAASVLSDRFCIERLDVLKARIQKWMEIKYEEQQMFGEENKGKLREQIHLERRKEMEQEIQEAAERGDELYRDFQTKWAEMVEAKMPAKEEGNEGEGMWHTLAAEWKAAMLEQFRRTAYKAEHLVSAMDLTSCTYQMFVDEWPTAQNGIGMSKESDCAKSKKPEGKRKQQTNSNNILSRRHKTVEIWLDIVAGKFNLVENLYKDYLVQAINLPECQAASFDSCRQGGHSLFAYLYVKEKGVTNGRPYGGMQAANGCNPYPFLKDRTVSSEEQKIFLECSNMRKCTNEKWERGVQLIKVRDVRHFMPVADGVQLPVEMIEKYIMHEIMTHGSVSASFFADLSIYFYKKGIYKAVRNKPSKTLLNFLHKCAHIIRLIGWGQTVSKKSGKVRKYWIAGNTYGEKWGDKGMFLVARGINECGVESNVHRMMPYGFYVENLSDANATNGGTDDDDKGKEEFDRNDKAEGQTET